MWWHVVLLLVAAVGANGGWVTDNAMSLASSTNQTGGSEDPFVNRTFFEPSLGIGTVLVFSGAFLCSGAGIGGGGIFVPTFILVLDLNAHYALPLSQVTILGVSMGSLAFLLPRRHPTLPRRLVDLSLAALLEPATLLGTIPGVYLNVIFPSYLITIFLALLLLFIAISTLHKGVKQYREEKFLRASVVNEPSEARSLIDPEGAAVGPVKGSEVLHDGVWMWKQWLGLVLTTCVLALSLSLKILWECESIPYWACVLGSMPPILCICVYFALQPPKRSRFPWIWSVAGFAAGLVAGFFGIGGGMVKSPLMIQMGTTPQVAAATASFMIFFTSIATVLQFTLLHRLQWEYSLWFGAFGCVGSFLGQLVLARVLKRYQRQSFVSFFVGLIVALSMVALVATNVLSMVQGTASTSFNSPCAGQDGIGSS